LYTVESFRLGLRHVLDGLNVRLVKITLFLLQFFEKTLRAQPAQ
jgi:hypothetical protein